MLAFRKLTVCATFFEEEYMSSNRTATADDAQLILRLYELRREEKMRAARDWYMGAFFPQSIEDIGAIANAMGTKENAYFRMVTSYWDMAASFVVHGSLSANLFLASSGEMFVAWAKIEEFIPQMREVASQSYLSNIEKVIQMQPDGAERVKMVKARIRQMRDQQAKQVSG
jgi:hypothetical protein